MSNEASDNSQYEQNSLTLIGSVAMGTGVMPLLVLLTMPGGTMMGGFLWLPIVLMLCFWMIASMAASLRAEQREETDHTCRRSVDSIANRSWRDRGSHDSTGRRVGNGHRSDEQASGEAALERPTRPWLR